ncbi:hypothetical protein OTU49_006916 [Cherax quadricarinatus]|uniref:Uncharacterized protein n=1 Tax=Cherax quadricarinatus TaxID=27406 RepID=A0AAW0WZA8_CHEQU
MQLSVTLLGCLAACVSAFPVMFLAYSDGRALTRRASLLDCNPPLPGLPPSYRCVDMDGHEVLHSDSLVSDDSKTQPHYPQYPTRLTPVEVGYEKRKKCPEGQIYVPEVDICSDIDPVILPPKFSHKKEAGSKKEKN